MVYFPLLMRFMFTLFVIALSFIDYNTLRLPDRLTFPLLGIGLLNAALLGRYRLLVSLLSALIAGGIFWLIRAVFPQGMGLGDVKFVAALASFLSFPKIIFAVFLASLVGSLIGGVLILRHKFKLSQQIPFGPYLSLGALIVLFWGNKITQFCWSVFTVK